MDLRGRVIPAYQLDEPIDYPITRLPAVTWRCQRCGQLPTRGPCTCGKRCYYCRHCLVFGKLRTCDYLVTDPRPLEPVQADHHAELNLTVDQQPLPLLAQSSRRLIKRNDCSSTPSVEPVRHRCCFRALNGRFVHRNVS